jgi:hypothetical protein
MIKLFETGSTWQCQNLQSIAQDEKGSFHV